jgi:acyl-CoA thioesterase I
VRRVNSGQTGFAIRLRERRGVRIIASVIHRGVARHVVVATLFVALVTAMLAVHLAVRARGADASRCERFAADSVQREQAVTGSGQRVLVVGDSYSAGLGLDDIAASWPSRLAGRIEVAGFSGSGFSRHASRCSDVSFATRARSAVRPGTSLVVVEGGLNDFDQPAAEIRTGFERLMRALDGHRVVVVGPPSAPSRARAVPRVDAQLAALAQEYGVAYVRTSGWDLPYLDDRLHLTPAGHRQFGDGVARAIAALS